MGGEQTYAQPTYDLRFRVITVGEAARVTILVKNDEGTVPLGTSHLEFAYNRSALAFPLNPEAGVHYRFFRFDNTDLSSYGPGRVSAPSVGGQQGRIALDITLQNGKGGTAVERAFMEVAEIIFRIIDPEAMADLEWQLTETQLVGSDGSVWQQGILENDGQTGLRAGQTIPFVPGWNWFSINRQAADPEITRVLRTDGALEGTVGDLIKSQTQFSLYEPAFARWIGTLTNIEAGPTYQIKLAEADTLYLHGATADRIGQIVLTSGWNWVGYLPDQALALNDALSLLATAQTNDLIKSQFAFAQYLDGVGWLGSLTQMEPGFGYLLRVAQGGPLDYPDPASFQPKARTADRGKLNEMASAEDASAAPGHPEAARAFAQSMSVVATWDAQECAAGIIEAYHGTSIRGRAKAHFIPALDAHRAFLTIYGEQDEALELRVSSACSLDTMPYRLSFVPDGVLGSLTQPLVLETASSGDVTAIDVQAFPNPFIEAIQIVYTVPKEGAVHLAIFDMLGREVAVLMDEVQEEGHQRVSWTPSNLARGTYFYWLTTANGQQGGVLIRSH